MLDDRLRASGAIMQADRSAKRHIRWCQTKLRPPEITHNAKPINAQKNGIDPFELGLGMQPTAINPDQTKWKRQKHGIGISIKCDRDRARHPKHEGDVFYKFFGWPGYFKPAFLWLHSTHVLSHMAIAISCGHQQILPSQLYMREYFGKFTRAHHRVLHKFCLFKPRRTVLKNGYLFPINGG